MANRSYLYSASLDENGNVTGESGILEWNWDHPLIHLVLMRGNPRLVESSIWPSGEEERVWAILADYDVGVEAAKGLFAQLGEEHAADCAGALEFLADPGNRQSHFLLEIAEIADMGDEDFEDAANALLERIRNLDVAAEVASLSAGDMREATGGGYWSRYLYYSRPPVKRNPPIAL
jgi:hypothetical protein